MSLSIKNFKVLDTSTGKMAQNGRRSLGHLETMVASKTFLDNLQEKRLVYGTPKTIKKGNLVTTAHMSTQYIKINRGEQHGTNDNDVLNVMTRLRLTKLTGTSDATNMLCYAWANSLSTASTNLSWNVAFANFNEQTQGDYLDIDLPNNTSYPNLYLALLIINGAWDTKTIENQELKICSIPGNNLVYFSITPSQSSSDTNYSHCIVIKAYNSRIGLQNRVCLAFEDWHMNFSDRDYNDVVISLQDACLDDNNINDTSIE
jgi:hypothetical protein